MSAHPESQPVVKSLTSAPALCHPWSLLTARDMCIVEVEVDDVPVGEGQTLLFESIWWTAGTLD